MPYRRIDEGRGREEQDEGDDELRVISGDDDDDDGENLGLFEEGQTCHLCGAEDGRIGLDPTCRGTYDGDPVLVGERCAPGALKEAWAIDGIAAIVAPLPGYDAHYYYRLDEMPAYQFVREDIEALSWLLLTIGDACARCGEQSHVAWLPREMVDTKLPEGKAVFRNLERDFERLCCSCAAESLSKAYLALKTPLITAEVPRSAMGVLIPTKA